MAILDGNKISKLILQNLGEKISSEQIFKGKRPSLATILVGENPASEIYIKHKHTACENIGIDSRDIRLPHETTTTQLVEVIDELNNDNGVSGILIQLPLPVHIDKYEAISTINPIKDVDGLHPFSLGDNFYDVSTFIPCTPKGILRLLAEYKLDNFAGKHAVIIGTSEIVGKPLAIILNNLDATVTMCNVFTKSIDDHVRTADIIISATGKTGIVKTECLKSGCIILDVGIIRDKNNNVRGDIDFDEAFDIASYITPVPGGVGPMTVAMLMENTITAYLVQDAAEKL